MPFTLAHPALVLPLGKQRYRLSLTALAAGSMAPDLEFFLQMKEVENIGHHWYGILLFDMPVAWLCCYLFHGILKQPLVANLPSFYRNRLMPLAQLNWMAYAAAHKTRVLLSLLVGVLTHILADGFTHYDGIFVQLWPALSATVHAGSHQLPVYYLLQIVFSIAGMIGVLWAVCQLPEKITNVPRQHNKYYWSMMLLLFTVILFIRITGWPQHNSFWGLVMAGMGALTYAWVLGSVLVKHSLILKNKT